MNYNVSDKAGWTLAEGRIQRNREEAARVVERIERNQRIERLVALSEKSRQGKSTPEATLGEFLHYRQRSFAAPMATFSIYRHKDRVLLIVLLWLIVAGAGLITWIL